MNKRVTIQDLAEAAGVSVATVDRVLNGRLPVREETARRVYDAASAIGYHAVGLLRQRVFQDLPQYRLGFLLQRSAQPFYQAMQRDIERVAQSSTTARITTQVAFADSSTPSVIIEKLMQLGARNRAIALVAPDYPAITAAVEALKSRGIAVYSLLSDFAPGVRDGYIGLNNRKAGRTAAWLISRTSRRPGKVACFVGSHRFHGHELREMGFRSYFREHAPDFELLDTQVNLETADFTHEATLDLIKRHPDLTGFYVCGGGMEGAISAIREQNLAGRIAVVVNELTQESRAALADDAITMVIDTPLSKLCTETIAIMTNALQHGTATIPGQSFLPFDLYTSENI